MDKRMKSSEVSGHAHAYRALDNRGMTLVEVIISILILSILLIAILSMTDVSIGVFSRVNRIRQLQGGGKVGSSLRSHYNRREC